MVTALVAVSSCGATYAAARAASAGLQSAAKSASTDRSGHSEKKHDRSADVGVPPLLVIERAPHSFRSEPVAVLNLTTAPPADWALEAESNGDSKPLWRAPALDGGGNIHPGMFAGVQELAHGPPQA